MSSGPTRPEEDKMVERAARKAGTNVHNKGAIATSKKNAHDREPIIGIRQRGDESAGAPQRRAGTATNVTTSGGRAKEGDL
jgi:hypothetical protein